MSCLGLLDNRSSTKEKSKTALPVVKQLPRLVTKPQPGKGLNDNNSANNPNPNGLSLLWNTSRTSVVEGIIFCVVLLCYLLIFVNYECCIRILQFF